MLTQIQTINDVKSFAKQIIAEGTSFHPDDDFSYYMNFADNKPCYSKEETDFRNELMSKCFDVCEKEGKDIYDVMLEVTLTETGMDKIIPLPSSQLG